MINRLHTSTHAHKRLWVRVCMYLYMVLVMINKYTICLLSHDHFKFFYDELYSNFYIFLFICLSGFQRTIPWTLTPNFHQMKWNQRSPSFDGIDLSPKFYNYFFSMCSFIKYYFYSIIYT